MFFCHSMASFLYGFVVGFAFQQDSLAHLHTFLLPLGRREWAALVLAFCTPK